MIIYFCVENFLSFQEKVEFNMLATPDTAQTDKGKHIPAMELDLLRVAAVYGANNAGKSNFVKALAALKAAVVEKKLDYQPFLLNDDNLQLPSRFELEFITNERAYRYGIAYFADYIAEEYLYELALPSTDAKLIFSRKSTATQNIELDYSFSKDDIKNQMRLDIYKNDFLKPNQPFISVTDAVFDKVKIAYDFFLTHLLTLSPNAIDTQLSSLTNNLYFYEYWKIVFNKIKDPNLFKTVDNPLSLLALIPKFLPLFDTGIERLELVSMSFDDYFRYNLEQKVTFLSQLNKQKNDVPQSIVVKHKEGIIAAYNNNKEPTIYWTEAVKTNQQGKPTRFNLQQESDGTRKLLALFSFIIIAFIDEQNKNQVLIFDEIERSLHTYLLNQLLPLVLGLSKSANQLIFSTHELSLLDLLPTDATWFVSQNEHKSSEMYSLWEFEQIKNVSPQKGYLQGRYGAIANLEKLKQEFAKIKQQQAQNERKQNL